MGMGMEMGMKMGERWLNTTCHVAVNLLAISWYTRPNYNNTHDMTAKFSLK